MTIGKTQQQKKFVGYTGGGFPTKPKSSGQHQGKSAAVIPQIIDLQSNQYRVKLSKVTPVVYQYALDVTPDEFWEAHKVHALIRRNRRALESALGLFLVSGKSIYTLVEIDETLLFNFTFAKTTYKLSIDKDTVVDFDFKSDFTNKENSVS